MGGSVLVDAGFLVALLSARDNHHRWAATQAVAFPPPWITCESALSEAFYLLGKSSATLAALLRRGSLAVHFDLAKNGEPVLRLIEKYADVPMSLADASLVRMTEIEPHPILLTTDRDFRIYRRHGRNVVPCVTP